MPYTLTRSDIKKIDAEDAKKKGTYQLTKSDIDAINRESELKRGLSAVGHGAENFAGGAINPLINTFNLAPEAANAAVKAITGHPNTFADIPDIPVQAGIMSDIGNLAGYAIPATGALKAIEAGVDVGRAAMGADQAAQTASHFAPSPSLAKSVGANVAAGGAVSPQGDREQGMVYGGAGGGAGHLLGRIAPTVGRAIKQAGLPEAASRFTGQVAQKLPFRSDDEVNNEMIGTIGQRYVDAKNKSVPLYKQVFQELHRRSQVPLKGRQVAEFEKMRDMTPQHLEDYHNTLGGMTKSEARTIKHAVNPEGLEIPDRGDILDPEKVHYAQSKLGNLSRKYKERDPALSSLYNEGRQGLKMSLQKFIKGHDQLDKYNDASKSYAKDVAPFINKLPNGAKNPLEELISNLDDKTDSATGITTLEKSSPLVDFHNIKKVTSPLFETAGDTDLRKLNFLTKALGGDRDKAIEYTKHNLFKNTFNNSTGKFDSNKFINQYDKLSNAQREALFNPVQEAQVETLKRAHGIMNDNRTTHSKKALAHLVRLGTGIAAAMRFGGGLKSDALMGAAGYGAAPIAKSMGTRFSNAFVPTSEEDLAKYLSPKTTKPVSNRSSIFSPANVGAGVSIASSPDGFNNGR